MDVWQLAVAFLAGLVCGVLSVAKASLAERKLYGLEKYREGFEEACADPAIRRLRRNLYRVK